MEQQNIQSNITPNDAAASLAYATTLSDQLLKQGNQPQDQGHQPQPAQESPQQAPEPQEDNVTPRIDGLEKKFTEFEDKVKNEIKDQIDGLKTMIKETLMSDEQKD